VVKPFIGRIGKKDAKIRQSERIIDINFCLFSGGGIRTNPHPRSKGYFFYYSNQ
jgi:hypothetical protein